MSERTVAELEKALAKCIAEKDELVGGLERARDKIADMAFDMAAARSVIRTQLPAALPYPTFCSHPEKCAGKSTCQAKTCCAD
jgi:hypothetical protein